MSTNTTEALSRALRRYPDRILSLKVVIAMSVVLVPCVLSGEAFVGVSLSLGVLAGALSKTVDHQGRIKALLLTLRASLCPVHQLSCSVRFLAFCCRVVRFDLWIYYSGGLGEVSGHHLRGYSGGTVCSAGCESSPSPCGNLFCCRWGRFFYGLILWGFLCTNLAVAWEQLAEDLKPFRPYLAKALMFPVGTGTGPDTAPLAM
jgi:hypothetical protein